MPVTDSYGLPEAPDEDTQEYLTIHFSASDDARQERWRNYGLSADFLGDYFANFFPGEHLPGRRLTKRDVIKGTVTFVANELIENAIKFNHKEANQPIEISLRLYSNYLVFRVVNYTSPENAERFRAFVEPLSTAENPEMMMIEQMERVATTGGDSHMGILTMVCDYSVSFGWHFYSLEPDSIKVAVVARLDLE